MIPTREIVKKNPTRAPVGNLKFFIIPAFLKIFTNQQFIFWNIVGQSAVILHPDSSVNSSPIVCIEA
jgi:hypothetical protein